jgi:uncharacterized protein (DUF2252 family)
MPDASPPSIHLDRKARLEHGKNRRSAASRVGQAQWKPRAKHVDPVEILIAANRGRLPHLVQIKFARMVASPFGFFRGAVPLMALDLSKLPVSGIHAQICGDAHVRNFGAYAAPDGRLVFDINDFDETITGPWEWDIKRMAASIILAGREAGHKDASCEDAVGSLMRAYRGTIQRCSALTALELARFEVHRLWNRAPLVGVLKKAERATPLQTLAKFTVSGKRGMLFKEHRPLIWHLPRRLHRQVLASLRGFRETLQSQYQHFFDQYHPQDVVFKVVGTGSVGTRDYVVLFLGSDRSDPLFLQLKEEPPSSYAPYLPRAHTFLNEGQRVVDGQHRMQSRCDIFLGWTAIEGRDFLVRQLRDHKASIEADDLSGSNLTEYSRVCGELLAKGHARSGDPCLIAGYCGKGPKLDKAITGFAIAYANQTTEDHRKLVAAVKRGRIRASLA